MDRIRWGWLCLAVVAGGCASDGKAPKPRTVNLTEFAAPPETVVEPTDTVPTDEVKVDVMVDVNEEVVVQEVGQDTPPTGGTFVADSLVGQVNGRPIYADDFFEPIQDELIALSRRLSQQEFVSQALNIIQDNLQLVVLNELFLAEAEAGLTPEQQQGILFWLKDLRERTVAQGGGVESVTQARLQSEEGVTLDEYVDQTKKRALIASLLDEKIAPRVIVSWRDIEREYERHYDEFNPPANITIARIRLSTERDAETIEQITTRFADGEAFQVIATELDQWNDGVWRTFQLGPEGVPGIELGDPARAYLVELDVGGTTPAFQVASSTMWLHITEIEQPPGRSLYDPQIQRMLAQQLHMRRSAEERAKYIASLLDEGIYDELDGMVDRLLVIALRRYGPRS
jgi:hypothetical protein